MKAAMRTVKNNAMLYSEAEKLVREATSNDAWGASSTLMCKIADLTTQNEPYMSAMKMMWKRLTDLAYPRHILKSLLLVEFLLRNASERFVLDMQQRIRRFESIAKFSDFKDEPQLTRDVKSRAEAVLRLLNNNEQRQEERLIAQRMRSKMASISNHQNYASSYNGRANQSPNDWTSTDQFSGTRDTGSPNYGDYYQNERENSAFGDSSHRSHSSTPKSKPKKKKKETNAVKQRQTDTNSPTLQSKNEQSSEQDEKKAARRRKRKEAKQAKLKNAEEADITNLNLFSEYDTKTNSDFATQSDGQIFTNNVQSYPVQAKAQADFTTSQSNRIAHNESSANFAHNSGNDFFSSVQPNDEVNASFDDDDDDDTSNDWLSCTVSTQSLNANCDFFEQQTPPVSTSTFTSATPNDTTLQASNMNSQMGVADTLKHTFDQQHQSNSLASSIQNNAGVIPYPVQPTSSSTTNFVASSHEANNTSKHNDDDDGDIWSITKNLTNLDSITSKSERNDSKHIGNTNEYPKTQQQQAQNYGLEPINLLQSKQQNYSPQISSDGFGLPQWNETNSTQFNTQIHNPHHQQQQQPYQQQPFQQQYQHQQYQQQQYQQYQPQQQQQPLQPYQQQQQQQPLQPYQQQQQQQPLQSYQQQQQQQQMAMSQQHNLYQQSYQPNQHQSYH